MLNVKRVLINATCHQSSVGDVLRVLLGQVLVNPILRWGVPRDGLVEVFPCHPRLRYQNIRSEMMHFP